MCTACTLSSNLCVYGSVWIAATAEHMDHFLLLRHPQLWYSSFCYPPPFLFSHALLTPRHRLPYSVPFSPFLTSLFVILKSCPRHPPVFLPPCHSAALRVDFHKTCPQQRPDNVLLSTHASRSSKAGRRLVGFLGHPLFSQPLKNNWLKQTGSRWTIGWIYLTFMHECTWCVCTPTPIEWPVIVRFAPIALF